MKCRCDELSELRGVEAEEYANEHLTKLRTDGVLDNRIPMPRNWRALGDGLPLRRGSGRWSSTTTQACEFRKSIVFPIPGLHRCELGLSWSRGRSRCRRWCHLWCGHGSDRHGVGRYGGLRGRQWSSRRASGAGDGECAEWRDGHGRVG